MLDLLDCLSFSDTDTITPHPGEVFDIGGSQAQSSTHQLLERLLDGEGNSLDKDVFYLDDKWEGVSEVSSQTRGEHEILSENLETIISLMPDENVGVEFGPGTFTKTRVLLDALDRQKRRFYYFAVDINKHSLQEHIPILNRQYQNITCVGLWGTFDQALERFGPSSAAKVCIWSFGSSLSNAPEEKVAQSFQSCGYAGLSLFLGQDGAVDKNKIEASYHTKAFDQFMRNGLQAADKIIGQDIFANDMWTQDCTIGNSPTRHTFVMKAKENIRGQVNEGTCIETFTSFKYTVDDIHAIASKAGCTVTTVLAASCAASRIYHIRLPGNGKMKTGT